MSNAPKSKTVARYTLQIWLTSLLLGSIVGFFDSKNEVIFDGFHASFFFLLICAGLFVSFPCFLLLWATTHFIDRLPLAKPAKKIAAAIASLVIGSGLFLIMLDTDEKFWDRRNMLFMSTYMTPLLVAVFVYRWPRREEVESESCKKV